jgi:hypothetical protein
MPQPARTDPEQHGSIQLRSERLEWREVDGEIVALDLDDSEYLAINPAGGLLWPALARGCTHEQLVATLVREYGIDSQIAARDVDAFIDGLDRRGLLIRG